MEISAKIRSKLNDFFFAPSMGQALSAVRIVVGIAMLIEAISVFPYLDDLYGQFGLLQADLIEMLTGLAVPGLMAKAGIDADSFSMIFRCFYLVHIAFALAFLLGFRARYATVGLWITQTIILNSGYLSSYGVDRYFHNLLFLMIWMPVAQSWSVDRWWGGKVPESSPSCTFGLRMLQFYILLTYISAGYGKSLGSDWWTGEAVWRALNQPEFRRYDFFWLAGKQWLAKVFSWGTMVVEGFYFLAVYVPRLGPLWVLGIMGMHLGIAFAMNLTLFGVTLAFINAALFLIPVKPKALL